MVQPIPMLIGFYPQERVITNVLIYTLDQRARLPLDHYPLGHAQAGSTRPQKALEELTIAPLLLPALVHSLTRRNCSTMLIDCDSNLRPTALKHRELVAPQSAPIKIFQLSST
jgi:hypothetical protein